MCAVQNRYDIKEIELNWCGCSCQTGESRRCHGWVIGDSLKSNKKSATNQDLWWTLIADCRSHHGLLPKIPLFLTKDISKKKCSPRVNLCFRLGIQFTLFQSSKHLLDSYQLPSAWLLALTEEAKKRRRRRDFSWKHESDYRSETIRENVIIIKTDGVSRVRRTRCEAVSDARQSEVVMRQNWKKLNGKKFNSTEIVNQDSSLS